MDAVRFAGLAFAIVGLVVASLALVGVIVARRQPAGRLRALGVVYLGFFMTVTSSMLLPLSYMGDGRLPVLAGVVPLALLAVTALRLRLAASRSFTVARGLDGT